MTPKIIELIIQEGDEEAGLDGIALVELPAHEALFEYFNQEQTTPCEDGKCSHYVLSDDEIPKVIQMFHAFGEPQGFLEKEGWEITSIKNVGKQEFQIISNPNQPSAQDTPDVRFRYKYVGPKDDKNRTFCSEMMNARRVFRIEDIMEMSKLSVNEIGPDGYDIFTWRGSYNCRHKWVQLIYEPQGRIINNDKVDRNVTDEDGMPGPDTRTITTINAGNTPPRTGFAASNPDVSTLSPYVDQITKEVEKKPVLSDETFEKVSIDYDETLTTDRGMELAKRLIEDGVELYIISARQDKEPMLKRADELGIPHSKIFATGSNKAKIAKINELGITKHHDNNRDVIKQLGEIGVNFAELTEACWPGYEAIGTKILDGKEVPNCVPEKMAMQMMKEEFQSYNDYPESAKNNACKAIKWKEQYKDQVKGMTQIGWIRANQLCKGENISEETIARMSGFERHRRNAEVAPEFKSEPWRDAGYVAWLGWGGTTGINWASDKLKSIRNEMSFSVFSSEERIIIGPAMIPDKMIIRRNEITGEIYYVFFTAETIKQLQQKFMLEKLLDKTNIEHGRRFLNGVSVVESWIIENPELDKQKVFNMNYPKGTWMLMMKVEDDAVWDKVKNGKLKGFSVQGYFLEKAKFNSEATDLIAKIKSILKEATL